MSTFEGQRLEGEEVKMVSEGTCPDCKMTFLRPRRTPNGYLWTCMVSECESQFHDMGNLGTQRLTVASPKKGTVE